MSEPHIAALLAKLEADDADPALAVYNTVVPHGVRPPYVLVRFATGHPEPSQRPGEASLVMESERISVTASAYSVGLNGDQTQAFARRVAAAWLDWTPTVSGRQCWPVRHVDSQDIRPDETTGVAEAEQLDIYRLDSIPA